MDECKQQNRDMATHGSWMIGDKNLFDLNKEKIMGVGGRNEMVRMQSVSNAQVSTIGFILWAGLLACLSIIKRRK